MPDKITEENEEMYDDGENLKDTILKGKMGLMSHSLNTFQIKNISPGQWVGEELMNHPKSPYRYSVLAINKVIAMEIKIHEFFSKFPKEMITRLQQLSKVNEEWIKNRIKAISKTSKEISNKNPFVEKIDDDFSLYFKKYPKINSRSLTKIRMHAMSEKSIVNKKLYYTEKRKIEHIPKNSEMTLFNPNSKSNLNLHRNINVAPSLINEAQFEFEPRNNITKLPIRIVDTKQKLFQFLNLENYLKSIIMRIN